MYTIGIDEVGRGPLAGPVVVACVALPDSFNDLFTNHYALSTPSPLRDSKKLTAIQRTAWNAWIRSEPTIRFYISRCSPKTIDRVNISAAANRAAYRAYKKLTASLPTNHYPLTTLLDAGIKLPKTIPQKAIIKGDEKIPAIALASILAKVARDGFM